MHILEPGDALGHGTKRQVIRLHVARVTGALRLVARLVVLAHGKSQLCLGKRVARRGRLRQQLGVFVAVVGQLCRNRVGMFTQLVGHPVQCAGV